MITLKWAAKSTIAAHAFQAAQADSAFDVFVWRDCKEESERFENQLIDIIVRLSEGRSSANDLSHQDMPTLAKLLVSLAGEKKCMIVFDNVDHYIDLSENRLVGNAQEFLSTFLRLPSASRIVFNLGRSEEYFRLIDKYQATIPHKDARYINLCALRCNMHWCREEYADALQWGSEGKEIKDRTNVDTKFSTDHSLALTQRDAGQPDVALTYFLGDRLIDKVINPDEFDEELGHVFYGNIGRCLHLMGQIEPALVCYRKSALLLQRGANPHVENQGYARLWIGELLIVKNDFCAAQAFLQAAISKWRLVAPQRATKAEVKLAGISEQTKDCRKLSSMDRERFVTAWLHDLERRRQR